MEKRNEKNAESFLNCFTGIGDSAADVAKGLASVQNMIGQLLSVVVKHGKGDQVVIEKDFDFGLSALNRITGVILDYQDILNGRGELLIKAKRP